MNDIVLTGFMGTGKSTVGRLLAERYGLEFVDLDEEISRAAGRSIPEMFAEGEETFREAEYIALAGLGAGRGRVIATGGGALLPERNRAVLGQDKTVVCLRCGRDQLALRLSRNMRRPLVSRLGVEGALDLLQQRQPVYSLFPQVDSSGTPDVTAERVAAHCGLDRLGALQFERTQRQDIRFGQGIAGAVGNLLRDAGVGSDVLLVTDAVVQSLGLVKAAGNALCAAGFVVHQAVVPSGEQFKTLRSLGELYEAAGAAHLDRQSTVVAVGGGVIGDLAGMLAATYLRGLRFVNIPTTLLAQVDAAIGGKVGIDLPAGKNLAGAFHPARFVLLDPQLLETLSGGRLREGLAEMVKIGLVRNASLFAGLSDLDTAWMVLRRQYLVRQAALAKVDVVQSDPYEGGERALLNFGHTVGHGVEAASNYTLSHGESVAVGMVAETWLAERMGVCGPDVGTALRAVLSRIGLPLHAPGIDADAVWEAMAQDKKRAEGQLRFALPDGIGSGRVEAVSPDLARQAVQMAVGA